MYNSQTTNPLDNLTDARISRIQARLRALTESTLEGYLSQVYSSVNGVLNIAGAVQPLRAITAEKPAVVGDITKPMSLLAEDAFDLVSVISASEAIAANLFNLAVSSQNQIKQSLREKYYASDLSRYLEPFLNSNAIATATSWLDFGCGQATLPQTANAQVLPSTLTAGPNSSTGADLVVTNSVSTAGDTLTSISFNGVSLELIATFATPVILNRIKVELQNYAGLELATLTCSPDGTIFEDLLNDLGERHLNLNGISGKLSGSVVLDFPPRFISQMRLVFNDRVGSASIQLNSVSFWSRQFSASSELVSKLITSPLGALQFSTDQETWGAYSTIVHQVSADGVHYTAISPGTQVFLSAPFYYKSLFQRVSSAFTAAAAPVNQDPLSSPAYLLKSTNSVNLGSNLMQRTLVFGWISGPVTLQENPLPGTLKVLQGNIPVSNSSYSFTSNVLSFVGEFFAITVVYQTSSIGSTAVAATETYYTPILRQVLFQQVIS